MITLKRISTIEQLQPIATHPDLQKVFLDFTTPEDIIKNDRFNRFGIYLDCNLIGYISFKDHPNNTVEFHGGVFKEYRGKETPGRLVQCLNIYKNKEDCIYFTYIPETNLPVISLVKKLDFKQIDSVVINNKKMLVFVEI